MSQSDRAIKKLATQLARLDREVKSWRGAQADFTSIENGGNFTFKDGDGNVTAIMGGQDDGSNTIRHVDGPVPPVPSGLAAHVDGPIVQVSWDGSFEDADEATYDWSHLEVVAVGPSNEQLTATINDVTGATANLAATASGEWTVVARSVSRAEKRSLDGDAGTVDVELVGLTGAINDAIGSANGKNTVTYSETAPTPADEGIAGDTWFVGSVADIPNPNNLAQNAEFNTLQYQRSDGMAAPSAGTTLELSTSWFSSAPTSLKIIPTGSSNATAVDQIMRENPNTAIDAGKTFTISADFHLDSPQTGSFWTHPRRILVRTRSGGSNNYAFATSSIAPNVAGTSRLKVTFTLPSDLEWWYFLLTNGSSTTPVYWDNLVIEEGTTDGLFWVTNDDGSWNVVEQYRHNGVVWKPVELNHEVIASVDLGKATVGELDGIRIMGQSIRGEQLSGDAIDGKVITAPTIQSARSGRRWVGDPNGIRIINEDDDVRTQLSPDGSTFKGEVEADTLVVNEGAEFKGNNTLAQGAKLTLAAGVTDPTAPPVVQPFWGGLEFEVPFSDPEFTGLAFDGTNYWTVSPTGQWATGRIVAQAIRINASTGAVDSFVVPTTRRDENFGVTCIGAELFWLYRRNYQAFVVVTDLNCVKLREWEYPELGYSKTNPLAYKPGIGNDGTNVVIAHCTDAGVLIIRTYNKTTGEQIGDSVRDTNDSTKSDITGVYVGDADWGRKLVTIAKASTSELPSFSATTGVYDGAATKFSAAATGSVGVVFHDGKFHTLDPSGVIHEYANSNTGDGSGDWWATYYWYTDVDDDDIIESTDYRSRMAPPKRFTWPRRAGLKILGQPMPTGVEALGPALAKKTTEPARTDFSGPGWQVDSGKPSARYVTLPTNWTTYASPSDTNTYPESTASILRSASSTFEVDGTGKGRWGQLEIDRFGRVRGLTVSGTVDQPNVATDGGKVENVVTFPVGRFDAPPVVFVQATNGAINAVVDRITATSCRIRSWNFTTYSVATNSVTWTAIGGSV